MQSLIDQRAAPTFVDPQSEAPFPAPVSDNFPISEDNIMTARLQRILSVVSGVLLLLSSADAFSADNIRLIAIGDSLVAGYGLPVEDGFVTQLEAALIEKIL